MNLLMEARRAMEEDIVPYAEPREIAVRWSGEYPCICSGYWFIFIDGEQIELPPEITRSPMGTYGTYYGWHFTDDWDVVWEHYTNGLKFPEWIKENSWWVNDLRLTPEEQEDLYMKINEQDWRHDSCGGCI